MTNAVHVANTPEWIAGKLRVTRINLDRANAWIERARAKHSAALAITGDRRARTLQAIEEEMGQARAYLSSVQQDLQDTLERKSQEPTKLIWAGSDRAFGEFVDEQLAQKKIPGAKSRYQAFDIKCAQYVRTDGTTLKPRSILQNLRNKKDEGK